MIALFFTTIIIFKKTLWIKSMAIKQSFHLNAIFSHLASPIVGSFGNSQVLMENIFIIKWVINPKIWVDHT